LSDEKNCSIIIVDKDYQTENAPKDSAGNATNVNVSFTILELNSFHEISMSYSAKFSIKLMWFDNRLTFANLQSSLDVRNKFERNLVWMPELILSNSLELKYFTNDGISSLTVQQSSQPYLIQLKNCMRIGRRQKQN
jgi:hypothetical protein